MFIYVYNIYDTFGLVILRNILLYFEYLTYKYTIKQNA